MRLFFIVILILLSFLSYFFYINLDVKTSSLGGDIEFLELKLANLQEREKRIEEVQTQINVKEEKMNTLKHLVKGEPDWLKIVYILSLIHILFSFLL